MTMNARLESTRLELMVVKVNVERNDNDIAECPRGSCLDNSRRLYKRSK
jgi:hypothetical protein